MNLKIKNIKIESDNNENLAKLINNATIMNDIFIKYFNEVDNSYILNNDNIRIIIFLAKYLLKSKYSRYFWLLKRRRKYNNIHADKIFHPPIILDSTKLIIKLINICIINIKIFANHMKISQEIFNQKIYLLIKKLLLKDIISANDMNIILCYKIILSLYHEGSELIHNIDFKINNIKNINELYSTFDFLISFTQINLDDKHKAKLLDVIKYFIKNIESILFKNNINNNFILARDNNTFNLLKLCKISEEIYDILHQFLIRIYKNQFNFDFIYNDLNEQFTLKNNKDIKKMTNYSKAKNWFLNDLFLIEEHNVDDFFINSGFIFNNYENNGIVCSLSNNSVKNFPSAGFSFVISFYLLKNEKNINKKSIFCFYSEDGKKYIKLYIENNILKFDQNSKETNLFSDIKYNTNYIFWMIYPNDNHKEIILILNDVRILIQPMKYPTFKYKEILLGFDKDFSFKNKSINNFEGILGTFILFNCCLINDKNDNQNEYKIKGLNKYYELFVNVYNKLDFIYINRDLFLTLNHSQKDLNYKIEVIISPKSLGNIKGVQNIENNFICNYFDFDASVTENAYFKFKFISDDSLLNNITYPIEFKNSLLEFYNNYGLKYIHLQLYFLLGLISFIVKEKKSKIKNNNDICLDEKEIKEINESLNNICLLFLYFINSKLYSYPSIKDDSDINNIIYTLNDTISISVKYGFKMKKILLLLLFTNLKSFLSHNLLMEKCDFIFIYENYDIKDEQIFELLFHYLIEIINENEYDFEDKVKEYIFIKIIKFDKIYIEENIPKESRKKYSDLIQKLIIISLKGKNYNLLEIYLYNLENIVKELKFYLNNLIEKNNIFYFKDEEKLEIDETSEDNSDKINFDIKEIYKIKLIYKYLKNLFVIIDSGENTKNNFFQFCSDKKSDLIEFFNGLISFFIQEIDVNINLLKIPKTNGKMKNRILSGYYSEMIKCLCILFIDKFFILKKIKERYSSSFIQNYIKNPIKKSISTLSSVGSFILSDNSTKNKTKSIMGSLGGTKDINNNDTTNKDNNLMKDETNNLNSVFKNFEFLNEINLSIYTTICFYLFLLKKQTKNKEILQLIKNIENKNSLLEFINKFNFSENFFINNKHYFDLINLIVEKLDKDGDKYVLIKLCFELNCEIMIKAMKFYEGKNSDKKNEILGYFLNYKDNCIFNVAIKNIVKLSNELSLEERPNENISKRKILYDEFLDSIKDNFKKVIECSLFNLKDPFYFVTINTCFIYNILDIDFILELVTSMIIKFISYFDSKIKEDSEIDQEIIDQILLIELNSKNLLYLIYKIIFYLEKRYLVIKQTTFINCIYKYLCSFLSHSNLFYMKILFSIEDIQLSSTRKKLIIEIIYEIILELNIEYILDPQKKYLENFKDLMLDILNSKHFAFNRTNKILFEEIIASDSTKTNKPSHTLFYILDKISFKNVNRLKFADTIIINKGYLKKIKIRFFDKYKNEFNEKENTYSICIIFIIKFLISIKYIDELVEKNKINQENIEIKNLLTRNFNNLCQDFLKLYKKFSNIYPLDSEGVYINGLYKDIRTSLINDYKNNKTIDINNYINRLLEYASDTKTFSRVIYNYPGIIRAYTYKDYKILIKNSSDIKIEKETNIRSQNISEKSGDALEETKNYLLHKSNTLNKRIKSSKKYNLNIISKIDNKIGNNNNEKKNISYIEKPLLKRDIINIYFSSYFQNMLIYDKDFLIIKKMYKYIYNNDIKDINEFDDFNCPLKIKNYISNNHYFKPFLKKDFNFYDSGYLGYSHRFLFNRLINKSIFDLREKILFPSKDMSFLSNFPNDFSNLKKVKNYDCELIINHGSIFGKFYIFENGLLFLSDYENDKRNNPNYFDYILSSTKFDALNEKKKIFIDYTKINEIINRTFCFHWTSHEFFMKNGKSYYFNFFKKSINDEIISIYKSKLKIMQFTLIQNPKEYFEKEDYTRKYKDNKITTYDYLLMLNKFSSRSYNNIMEYPIIPWLKYTKEIRDFDLPMSLQTEESKKAFEDKYYVFKEMGTQLTHSNHYSSAAYIYFYLTRINPFTNGMIKFQGNVFEIPERQFMSVYDTIKLCTSTSNNRESIPEIFEIPEIFYNINCNDLGKTAQNKREHNINLTPYANNGIEFCYDLLYDINNNIEINNNIHKWIDFVFGVNQYVNNPKEINFRRFNDEFYAQNSNFLKKISDLKNKKIEDKKIYMEVKDNIDAPLNFGITPYQILNELAPKKNLLNQNLIDSKNKVDEIYNLTNLKINLLLNEIVYFAKNKKNKNIVILYKTGLMNVFAPKYKYINEYELFYEIKIKGLKLQDSIGKYTFCEIKENIFIFCGFLEKTLKIYEKDKNIINYILDIYTTSIISTNEKEFITGHINGRLIKWELITNINNNAQNNFKLKKHLEIKSNKSAILSIEYNQKLNILLCSDYNSILIRGYYDFQFSTYIKIKEDKISINKIIKTKVFNYNLIYVLAKLNEQNSYELHCYSLNGTFYKKIEGNFNDFKITKTGDIIINNLNNKELIFYKGCHLDKLFQKKFKFINEDTYISSFDFEDPNILYLCNIKKEMISINKIICHSK